MKLRITLFTMLVVALISSSRGVIYNNCQLASELYRKYGIPKAQLTDWVCLVESESAWNTSAVGPPNTDGSRDHGLFQINSFYWCWDGWSSELNMCDVSCSSLIDNDISDDVRCAKLIFSQQGFMAWYGWQYKCKGNDLSSYLAGCTL